MIAAAQQAIADGDTTLGIELGSTRIKAVLIGPDHTALAAASYSWENQYIDRLWTYPLESVWTGLQECYAALISDVQDRYAVPVTTLRALGVSAMMHGYLPFDADDQLLVPFRTWRNTNTGPAVEMLSEAFAYNIPHRWSIAHLHQAITNGEPHVHRIAHLTTLAGYVHEQLTGQRVLGVGDASGMFPIDSATATYDAAMVATFDRLVADHELPWRLADLLPIVRRAGEPAGTLTETGARRLDASGLLQPGMPLCPPEGDAGTGMVATNSVAPRTGNVSAGTSIFAMVVLEQPLSRMHHALDLVTTPAGDPVAMVHCNNGASEISAWADLFAEFADLIGANADIAAVYQTLFRASLSGVPDCGGLLAYNYLSGEPITGLTDGRPMFLRSPDSTFNLATFMRTQLFAVLGTLRIGMDVLQKDEGARLDTMYAHGGLFATKGVAQKYLAAAIDTPVSVGATAAEGGAWGIAVLAAYQTRREPDQSLADYLQTEVFAAAQLAAVQPDPVDVAGFDAFMSRYVAALPVQEAAANHF